MFTTGDALRKGWIVFRENAGLLIGAHLFFVLLHAPQFTTEWLFPEALGLKALIVFATIILSYVVSLGVLRIAILLVDGGPASFGSLFDCAHLIFKYLIAYIVYVLITLAGLLLLIVPGVIWGVRFSLWSFYMVEHETGPIVSLKASFGTTAGQVPRLLSFYLACFGLFVAGLVTVGLAWFVIWPVTTVATAWIYRMLSRQTATAE